MKKNQVRDLVIYILLFLAAAFAFSHALEKPKPVSTPTPDNVVTKQPMFNTPVANASQDIASTSKPNASLAPSASPTASATPAPVKLSKEAGQVVALINKERAKRNLKPLTVNALLTRAAQLKNADMQKHNYWAHTSPNGTLFFSFIDQTGYQYTDAGENLAINFDTPQDFMNAWMQSKEHRDNILSPKYQDIGITYHPGDYTLEGEKIHAISVVTEFGGTN